MKEIKLFFTDFWDELDQEENLFTKLLRNEFAVKIDAKNPDILFYSNFGKNYLSYHCTKVFYTGENVRPDFKTCDYAISFDYPVTDRNYRYPLYGLYGDIYKICRPKDPTTILQSKTKFCNFVVSNPQGNERNHFFKLLNKYKKVDSGGRFMNNIGEYVKDKQAFLKPYKFTLAFENNSYPGYTTEKILQPMYEYSMPIYWGNPLIGEDFNTKSFINVHDFNSFEEAIEKIIEIDQSDDIYIEYLKQPYFTNNTPNKYMNEINLQKFLANIIYHLEDRIPNASSYQNRMSSTLKYFKKTALEKADFTIRNVRRKLNL